MIAIAIWASGTVFMNQHERRALCKRLIDQFNLPPAATYKDACRRVGGVLSDHLGADVVLRFVYMQNTSLSGATALRDDGTYIVYCIKSRSWYHRLGILLHELAHLVLGHQPVTLNPSDGLHHLMPHLPGTMARIIAGRTSHTRDEEREAEEFADALLERLTTSRWERDDLASSDVAAHVMRIAEGLAAGPQEKPGGGSDPDG
jgi:hypothetical protein